MQTAIWALLILAALLGLAISARAEGTTQPGAAGKPNVLMIVIDDLDDWVGCLGGHPQVKTPSIDELAARGTLFANAHAQAPLCNPSRTSVFSGLRPSTTGIYGLQPGPRSSPVLRDWVMLPQYFQEHGYLTARFGKVYHDGSIPAADKSKEFEVFGAAPGMALPKENFREVGSDLLADSSTMDFAQLCRQMRIADGPAEAMHPLNVGLMFFNPAPQKFFPQTQIDVVQFPEGPGGDTFTEKTFAGQLDVILKDALTFLKNAVIEERVVKHGDRPEADRFFNVPYAALEEAVVNAVYHRSYEIREPIEVRVLPDEITVAICQRRNVS